MIKKLNKIVAILLILCITFPNVVFAVEAPPEVVAETAILAEASTSKIIYEKDMDKKMYPASMTKLLTAIVALEHLQPDELVTVGNEINEIPGDSSKAGHTRGETLSVKNLIRGLLIPSGNDSANVLAVTVARKVKNDEALSYEECITVFTDLMNEKAKQLGATNSHFANAHGYHDENHYTTAHDMFLIAQEALKNNTIMEITKEKGYSGKGVEGDVTDNTLKIRTYNWTNHNLLVTDNEYQYEYAIGLKTGFMNEAGDCLAAAAQKDGITLIAVVCNSEDPGRWTDTKSLFEYGFNNFGMANLQKSGDVINTVVLSKHNRLLGDTLETVVKEDMNEYMLKEDIEKIEKTVEYQSELLAKPKKNDEENTIRLKAPIAKDAEIGKITYKLENQVIKEANIYAATEVEKSTIMSSIKYFFKNFTKNLFSVKTIIAIVGVVIVLVLLLLLMAIIRNRRNRRRSRYIFKSNRSNHTRRSGRSNRSSYSGYSGQSAPYTREDGPRMRRRRRK